MRKKDLKTGMRITNGKGETSIVLLGTSKGDIISCIGIEGTWSPLDNFNNDLHYKSDDRKHDIIKVEDAETNAAFLHHYETIWER